MLHDGDRWTAAAGVARLIVERALQSIGIEFRDAVDDDGIQGFRGGRVVVMRQIGAGHQQRTASVECRGERRDRGK